MDRWGVHDASRRAEDIIFAAACVSTAVVAAVMLMGAAVCMAVWPPTGRPDSPRHNPVRAPHLVGCKGRSDTMN